MVGRLGVGKNAAYDAAARGEIPMIRIGRLMRVPIAAFDRMLEQAGKTEPDNALAS